MTEKFTISAGMYPELVEQLARVLPLCTLPEGVNVMTKEEFYVDPKLTKPFIVVSNRFISMAEAEGRIFLHGAERALAVRHGESDAELLKDLNHVPALAKKR